jgi:hypothetical protein
MERLGSKLELEIQIGFVLIGLSPVTRRHSTSLVRHRLKRSEFVFSFTTLIRRREETHDLQQTPSNDTCPSRCPGSLFSSDLHAGSSAHSTSGGGPYRRERGGRTSHVGELLMISNDRSTPGSRIRACTAVCNAAAGNSSPRATAMETALERHWNGTTGLLGCIVGGRRNQCRNHDRPSAHLSVFHQSDVLQCFSTFSPTCLSPEPLLFFTFSISNFSSSLLRGKNKIN